MTVVRFAKKDLESALATTSLTIGSPTQNDFTSHLMMRGDAQNGTLDFLTTNVRFGSRVTIRAEMEDDVCFTVEGWRLRQWASAVVDDVVELHASEAGDVIIAKTQKSRVKLCGFGDMDKIRRWEEVLGDDVPAHQVDAKRLHAALSYCKNYTGEQTPALQGLSVMEVTKGTLRATDKRAIAIIDLPPIKECNLRIHGKDLGPVLSFLGSTGVVSVKDCRTALSFQREDGTVMVATKPMTPIHDVDLNLETPPHFRCVVSPSDVRSAILALAAGADRENRIVTLHLNGSSLTLKMKAATTGGDLNEVVVPASETEESGNVGFPKMGVPMDYTYLQKALSLAREGDLGLSFYVVVDPDRPHRKIGWVQINDTFGEDKYYTIIKWAMYVED